MSNTPPDRPSGEPIERTDGSDAERLSAAKQFVNHAEELAVMDATREKLEAALHRSETTAKWLDNRHGDTILSSVSGIPVIGPFLGAASDTSGAWIIVEAIKAGIPKSEIAKMVGNVALDVGIDFVAGVGTTAAVAVPIIGLPLGGIIWLAGRMADHLWKANKMNAAIFKKHVDAYIERHEELRAAVSMGQPGTYTLGPIDDSPGHGATAMSTEETDAATLRALENFEIQ